MIAIVDDDVFVRDSLRDLMESFGYEVAVFESAERFLEAACLAQTSCVITDLQMPGLSGLELQGRLIADGRYIPIIFVTAFPDEKFRARAMSAGAAGFLSKPFNERSLISCLESALSPSIVPFLSRFPLLKPKDRLCRAADLCHATRHRRLVSGVPAMDRI